MQQQHTTYNIQHTKYNIQHTTNNYNNYNNNKNKNENKNKNKNNNNNSNNNNNNNNNNHNNTNTNTLKIITNTITLMIIITVIVIVLSMVVIIIIIITIIATTRSNFVWSLSIPGNWVATPLKFPEPRSRQRAFQGLDRGDKGFLIAEERCVRRKGSQLMTQKWDGSIHYSDIMTRKWVQ